MQKGRKCKTEDKMVKQISDLSVCDQCIGLNEEFNHDVC